MSAAAAGEGGWIDVSVPLNDATVVWPGDEPVRLRWDLRIGAGEPAAEANLSSLTMTSHAGTHFDAPLHFVDGGATMAAWTPDATVGPARLVEIRDTHIETTFIESLQLKPGERLLFKTGAPRGERFEPEFPRLTLAAARALAERRPRMLGVDTMSVGGGDADGAEIHRILLGAGIWLVENLDLGAAEPGDVEFICLPLRVEAAEGAPARARRRPPARGR